MLFEYLSKPFTAAWDLLQVIYFRILETQADYFAVMELGMGQKLDGGLKKLLKMAADAAFGYQDLSPDPVFHFFNLGDHHPMMEPRLNYISELIKP
jgi:Zn-dependent protease with chaperone function